VSSAISRDSPRIYHLDPRDMSFNPDAVNELRYELKEFDVDLALLEKLLRQYRISLSEENIQSAFKELGEHSKYFSWFDQYSLKFCDEFQPFEDAYKGYLCFCGLFLQDTAKDDNILASMKECSFSHFDISQLDYSVSDEGRIQKLVKNIMRYLKGIKSPINEPADDLSFGETWIALEEISNEGSSNNAIKEEEALRVISNLKEQDLLKLYYQKLLVRSNGNISRASRMAGVPESTFRDRMNAVGIKFRKKDCEIDEAEPR
jgi:hypothetical protein